MILPNNIPQDWKKHFSSETQKPYFQELQKFLETEIQAGKTIYPKTSEIFSAFSSTNFEDIKVVILGQDPYHGENQAHGLSFSVPQTQKKIPPSLKNIFKEISVEYPVEAIINRPYNTEPSGNLEYLAQQGVFLLNATLTVEAGNAGSHQKKGWEIFTDAIIKKISDERENIVFLLWGGFAQKKSILIDKKKHCILTA